MLAYVANTVINVNVPCVKKTNIAVTPNNSKWKFLVPGSRFFNSLWPSGVIWRQRCGSTLAQVMKCCLTAPSHYLNQCWLMISEVLWHSTDSNFTEKTLKLFIIEINLKFVNLRLESNPPGVHEITPSVITWYCIQSDSDNGRSDLERTRYTHNVSISHESVIIPPVNTFLPEAFIISGASVWLFRCGENADSVTYM